MDCHVPGHDSVRAQRCDTHSNVHHQQHRHVFDELGHGVGYGIFFDPRRRREIIVRRIYNDSFVSRRDDVRDAAQVVSLIIFRGTVLASQ